MASPETKIWTKLKRNARKIELELRLEEGLNRLGLGPQGLTGNSSVIGVHIESAARHPSTIGVVRRDFRPDLPVLLIVTGLLWMPVVLL